MSELLTDLGTVGTNVLTYVGNVCTTIVDQPLLLLTVGFLFIGGVGWVFWGSFFPLSLLALWVFVGVAGR